MESSEASAPAGYEFSPTENETIGEAARWVGFWSWVSIFSGILLGAASAWTVDAGGLIIGVAYIVVGFYFRGAAGSLKSVVETAGNDISHLMTAIQKLSSAFKVMGVIVIVAVIFVLVVVMVAGATVALGT